MQVQFGKKNRIVFTDKKHPFKGILSVVFGVASLIILFVLCLISARAKGNSGIGIGVVGIFVLILSVVGFVMAIRTYKEEDIYKVTPAIGSVLNGILTLVLMILFFLGAI